MDASTDPARPFNDFGNFGRAQHRLQHRRADRRGPPDPAHVEPAQHRSDQRGQPRTGHHRLVDLRRPRVPHRHDLRRPAAKIGTELGGITHPLDRRPSPRQVAEHNIITASSPCPQTRRDCPPTELHEGRRAHHLRLLPGASCRTPPRAFIVRSSRARPSSSSARSRSTSRPSTRGARPRTYSALARPLSHRPNGLGMTKATTSTAHGPGGQPETQAQRRERGS